MILSIIALLVTAVSSVVLYSLAMTGVGHYEDAKVDDEGNVPEEIKSDAKAFRRILNFILLGHMASYGILGYTLLLLL